MAPDFAPGPDGLGQQPFHPFFPNPLAPARQRGRVDGQAVLKEGLAGEVLVIRVLDPAGDDGLIRQPIGMLEIKQPRHQPRRRGRTPRGRRKEPCPLPFEHLPVDQGSQLHQLVAQIDHVDQARTQQIILFRRTSAVLHRQTEIAGF